ncbi:MAG: hypothetical protein O7G85_02935 [Planctomycetota bacterium]|nr:hypothetical protein [Planctomycetota bacterium]
MRKDLILEFRLCVLFGVVLTVIFIAGIPFSVQHQHNVMKTAQSQVALIRTDGYLNDPQSGQLTHLDVFGVDLLEEVNTWRAIFFYLVGTFAVIMYFMAWRIRKWSIENRLERSS